MIEGNFLDALFQPIAHWLGLRHPPDESAQLFALALCRWLPVVAITPFLGGRTVPAPIKIGLSMLFAVWMLPWMSAHAPSPLAGSEFEWWAIYLREISVGVILGIAAGLLFWAAEMGGLFLDSVRGTTIANMFIPQTQLQSSILGGFYFQLFIVLYVVAGGHRLFLSAVIDSYTSIPPFDNRLVLFDNATSFIERTSEAFVIAIKLIGPALVVVILLDLTLAVAARMAPQLNVFFLSLSLKSVLAALVVGLSLFYVLGMSEELFRDHQRFVQATIQRFEPK